MWLMPTLPGAWSPVPLVTPDGKSNTVALGPPLTMTCVTGMFEVKLNSIGSPSSLTSVTVIVTDRVPSVNVLDSPTPRSSKSAASILNVVVLAGQLGLPCTTSCDWAGLELTTATNSAAATASAAAAAIVTIHRPESRSPEVIGPIPSPCSWPPESARGLASAHLRRRSRSSARTPTFAVDQKPATPVNLGGLCTERPKS